MLPLSVPAADFNYSQTLPKASLHLPGRVHQGFASSAASIWPPLRSALSSLLKSTGGYHSHDRDSYRSSKGIRNVYVSGHSLGAGVATSYWLGVSLTLSVTTLLPALPARLSGAQVSS